MNVKIRRRARHLVLVPGLVVLAAPAFADQPLPAATVTRLAPPPASIDFGQAVAGVGDVNADGLGDVLVGAPGSDQVFVVSGTGAILRGIPNSTAGLRFGASLASIGDVNRDGVADFTVGAPPEPPTAAACPPSPQCGAPGPVRGRVFVYSGASGDMVSDVRPPTTAGTGFGRSVTGTSDLSGDGVPDFVVGAPAQTGVPGAVFAFSGATSGQLWSRPAPSSGFGELVVSTPDVSGDGIDDVLVWSPSTSAGGVPGVGTVQVIDTLVGVLNQVLSPAVRDHVHILSGATGEVVRTIADATPNGNDAFGATMVPAGDQDGDSVVDHLIGERGANQLHLYSGRTGLLIRSVAAPVGAPGHGTFALARVDDKDGDGRDDFWVGVVATRAVYLINGQGTVLESAIGPSASGTFGSAVGTVGNIGGDPGADLVVGDPSEPGGGGAYLLHVGAAPAPVARARLSQAAGCSGAACKGGLRVRAQAPSPTTTVPTTTTSPATSTTQAAMDEAPATATLPKPANVTTAEGGLPGTGGVDRSVVGLAAVGLGMAGIAFVRRLPEPPPRRPPGAE